MGERAQGLGRLHGAHAIQYPLDRPVSELAAGEKQKLEIVKQLYLGRNFLVLDEPTSVLTPAEAGEMLGLVRGMTERGELTVLMISHKFHEVTKFADAVSILRRGKLVGSGKVGELSTSEMAARMIGDVKLAELDSRAPISKAAKPVLMVEQVKAPDRSGLKTIEIDNLTVRSGEIVGIAGISGNGQKELSELLAGQRPTDAGRIMVNGEDYGATRPETRKNNVRFIPEEPLQNACAPKMTVSENLAFRTFDLKEDGKDAIWLNSGKMKKRATTLIADFKVKTASSSSPISALSGGNVQRAVLATRIDGRGRSVDRFQSMLRARFFRCRRNPRPHYARPQFRNRGAAALRGPGRAARNVGPHHGYFGRQARL